MVKFCTSLFFLTLYALFFYPRNGGVFGSTMVLSGGGTCLGEAGVFVFIQVLLKVEEVKRVVQEAITEIEESGVDWAV